MSYTDPVDVAAKLGWEGGVAETILGYGLSSEEVKDAVPDEVLEAWQRVEGVRSAIEVISAWRDTVEQVDY